MAILKTVTSKVKTAISKVGAAIKAADVKLGGSYAPLSKQLVGGAKTAAIATGATTVATIPKVAATAVAATATTAKAAGSSVVTTAKKYPVSTLIGGTYAAGVITTSTQPIKTISKAPEAVFEAGQATGKVIETKSGAPLLEYAKEHPIAAGVATAGAAYLVGKGAAGALVTSKLLDEDKQTTPVAALPAEMTTTGAVIPTATTGVMAQPITPATQVMGKSATSLIKYKKRKTTPKKPLSVSTRVNIINQSRFIKSEKYIN